MLGSLIRSLFSRGGGSASVDLRAGMAAYKRGDARTAERLLGAAIKASPKDAEARICGGVVAFNAARYADAQRYFEDAIELEPGRGKLRYQAAHAAYMAKDFAAARGHCEASLALAPDSAPCQDLLSRIDLPGPDYLEVLTLVHETLRPRSYVEIGVHKGRSLVKARPETRAIGIDPEPRIDAALPAHTIVHAVTSDAYFATHDVKAELGGLPIDLAFIDGLHHFECALRDFINIEKLSAPESTILIHDCYPLNRRTAERENWSGFFSGDVWRLMLVLKEYRPDLRLHTIATAPTGLGVARGLDPESRVLEQNLERIVRDFMALDYDVLSTDKAGMLNRAPNDAGSIRTLLGQAPG